METLGWHNLAPPWHVPEASQMMSYDGHDHNTSKGWIEPSYGLQLNRDTDHIPTTSPQLWHDSLLTQQPFTTMSHTNTNEI